MINKLLGSLFGKQPEPAQNDMMEDFDVTETLFYRAATEREEKLYKGMFPNMPDKIITLTNPEAIAIGGFHVFLSSAGLFEIPPSDGCPYWTYLTSGLSNPLVEEPQEISGYGIELMMQLPEQSAWAANLLFNLMGYIMETGNVFLGGHRMPCNGPIALGIPCNLTTLLFWEPHNQPASFKLESGFVALLQIQGITDEEYEFCKENSTVYHTELSPNGNDGLTYTQGTGSEQMIEKLKSTPSYPAIDITRKSLV